MSSSEAHSSPQNGEEQVERFKRASIDYALPPQTPPKRTYSDDLSTKSGDETKEVKGENPDHVTETPTKGFLNLNPNIDDQSPAAEALRANAGVHVRRTTKLARKIHANAVRKIVKNATRVGMGNRRGKPPRIPPNRENSEESGIYIVEEEDVNHSESDDDNEEDGEYASSRKYSEEITIDLNKKAVGVIEDSDRIPAEVLHGTIETGKKLLAFADPHDIIQTNRWRRRRKRGVDKNRKSYVKGKVIDGQHELYTLSIAVMMGVRNSIGNTNTHLSAEKKRWLTSDDFMATEKYIFKPSGSARTPPHQLGHTFKFKDYSPTAFAYMRRLFGINEFDFLLSVCGNANFIEFISNAKSGQFFFYSSDGKFMIKTMTNAESKFLRRILPHYFRHCCSNPNTVLTKFLGMYRVKLYHLRRNVKFVIMNSVYYTDKYLQSFYDLKGSVTGRQAKPGQDVKKDNDLRNNMPESAIALHPAQRVRLRKQLVADCEFMTRMKIMDYSMLIGIHHVPQKGKGVKSDKNVGTTGFRFSDARKESLKFRELLRTSLRDSAPVGHQSMPNRILHENDGEHIQITRYGSVPSNITGLSFDSEDKGMIRPGSPARSSKSIRSIGSSSPMGRHLQRSSSVGSADSSRDGDYMKDSEKRFAHLAMYENGLDDDDDNSYLEGTTNNPVSKGPTSAGSAAAKGLELKKAQTIEKVYWPFHRLYDIHGLRRMVPGTCAECLYENCKCVPSNDSIIVPFVPPIFERKDAGYMMDTTGFDMPIKYCPANGKEFLCDGKIFYMGIIDILQQYNTRKRVEAKYRRVLGSGWRDASCVRPEIYAERFIEFFDQYSQRDASQEIHVNEGEEAIVFSKDDSEHDAKKEETKEEIEADGAVSNEETKKNEKWMY